MGYMEKSECLKRLHMTARELEQRCQPQADFDRVIEHERACSPRWGGMTVSGSVSALQQRM